MRSFYPSMAQIAVKINGQSMSSQQPDFRPFRAWRYHPGRTRLDQVIAPPYDVISPAEQETLYAKSPHNVVRLILGKEPDFYQQASRRWQEWSREGILAQDEVSALYLYEQIFSHPSNGLPLRRLAVVGLLKLEEPGAVFRHEATFEGPKRDRLSLLEGTQTNLSPVFGLYEDSGKSVAGLLELYRRSQPLFEAKDDQGVLHRGWAITKLQDQNRIREALHRGKILIADGHHRYETAMEYRREMRKKFPDASPEAPFNFVMMALVESKDKGLLVLPTHRILRSLAPLTRKVFLERLGRHFDFFPHREEELFKVLEAHAQSEKVFGGLFGREGSFLLRLKGLEAIRVSLPQGKPPVWYEIEANLLNHFMFDKLWGVSEEKRLALVEYTRSWEEAARKVREEKAEAAFLMRAPTVDTVRKLAYAGERLPQKTTYFYPKLASGLFFYYHDDDEK